MEDKQIIEALWSRTESAIDALADKFGKRLYGIAMNILGNRQDAEETINDVYIAIWNSIPPARPDPLGAYIYKVCKNTALKQLRQRTAQKRNSSYDLALDELAQILPAETMEDALDARALGDAINGFLSTLDPTGRMLFVRRYWFGDSIRQLSSSTGIRENVLSVRLHRIRTRLKDYLNKEGFWL